MIRTGLMLVAIFSLGLTRGSTLVAQEQHCVASSGGVHASNGETYLSGTIGQPVIGFTTSTQIQSAQGFWHGTPKAVSEVAGEEGSYSLLNLVAQPNPFPKRTMLSFTVPEHGNVVLVLYNSLGQHIRTVVESNYDAGPATVELNMEGLPSGHYTATLRIGDEQTLLALHFIE